MLNLSLLAARTNEPTTEARALITTSANPANLTNALAWRDLGSPDYDSAARRESADLIVKHGLNWKVEKEPMALVADGAPVDDAYALVRQDTRQVLGVVGNDYRVLQNRDAFGFLDSFLADGSMTYERVFSLKRGAGICLIARMPEVLTIAPGEDALAFLAFQSWHGGGAITCTPTAIRPRCANQMPLIKSRGKQLTVSIRHSGDLRSKLTVARHYLAQFSAGFDDYRIAAQSLMVGASEKQAREFLAELFPEPAAHSSERVRRNIERKQAEVRAALRSPANQADGARGTFWGLLNAVTETIDHGRSARRSRDIQAARENRFLSITTGEGAAFKLRAMELALSMAG